MKRSVRFLALLITTAVCISSVDAHGRFGRCQTSCEQSCQPCLSAGNVRCKVMREGDAADPGDVMTLYYCYKDPNTGITTWKARKFGIGSDNRDVMRQLRNFAQREKPGIWEAADPNHDVQTKPVIDMVNNAENTECFVIARAGTLDDIPCDCGRDNRKR